MPRKKLSATNMNSYSRKGDYIKRFEEAGEISGRTQKQANEQHKIDQIFDVQTPEPVNQDMDIVDQIFDFTRKLFN